jgi:hypothetical protein
MMNDDHDVDEEEIIMVREGDDMFGEDEEDDLDS